MSYDPFGEDPDADIFREDDEEFIETAEIEELEKGTGHKHTIDGSVCPTCDVVHSSELAEQLPPEAISAVLSFLDAMPNSFVQELLDGSVRDRRRPQAELITGFLSFASNMDNTNKAGPVLMAIVEHLDEQTGGLISAKWRIYELERRLVVSHKLLQSSNTALDDALSSDASENAISLLQFLVDFSQSRVEVVKSAYLEASKSINYEPVASIIENGSWPEDDERKTHSSIVEDLYTQLQTR